MATPPLRNDFTNVRSPLPNELPADEYNLNATRTDAAYDAAVTGLVESVQDIVGTMVVAGTNVTKSYNDTAGTLTLSAAGGGSGDPDVLYPVVTVGSSGAAAANTTAIQTAINTGPTVRLPKGVIYHNGLVFPNAGLVKLVGSGKGVTILMNAHATNPSILIDNTAGGGATCRSWAIRDLTVNATAIRATQIGISVHLAVNWDVSDVEVLNHSIGIRNQISWAGSYNNTYMGSCTIGFQSQLTAASAPLVFNNVDIYDCDTGLWSEDGLTGFSWHGGTVANSVTCGARFDGFSNGTIGFFGVDFESNTSAGDDVLLGDADSGPTSVLFDNCIFHSAPGSAHPRSVYARFGIGVTFNTCLWRDDQVLAVAIGSGMGTVTFINPRFNGVTTHVTSPTGSYQIPNGTSVFTAVGFGGNPGVARAGAVSRIRQVSSITSSATPAVNVDATELVNITAQAVPITSMSSGLTGTPFNGQQLPYRIKDNGTAQAITWGSSFSGSLPATTVAGQTLKVDTEYNSVTSKWEYIPSSTVDSSSVNAAGAVMESDTSTASMSFVVDEDNMASNSATKVPTQQSSKAYVDTAMSGVVLSAATSTAGMAFVVDEDNMASNSDVKVPTQQSSKAYVDTTAAGAVNSTSVDAAGAVMNADTTTAAMSFVIDEDTMGSNLDTKVPTQQSVRAFVVSRAPDIQVFAVGTTNWTRPAGVTATSVTQVIATGSGGGGGAGARELSGTVSCGGGGGGAGAITMGTFKTLDLTSTVSVTVGAGGAGGAAQTANSTAGAGGVSGGITTFGNYLQAGRGFLGGGGGAAVSGAAGAQGSGTHAGGPGGASSAAGNTVVNGTNGVGAGGGAAGGGINATPAAGAGGTGGISNTSVLSAPTGGAATGAVGSPGAVGPIPYVASGGGGGGASITAAGGNGGDGGTPGGGGGGGGAALNGSNSGAGGKGGDGYCSVITYL